MNTKEIVRFLKFTFISASAGLIEIGTFTALNELTSLRYWPCYLTALVLSVLWNYTINRKYTFRSNSNVPLGILLVAIYYLIFTPATTWLGDWLAETVGVNEYIVTAAMMILNLTTEFPYQRFVIYRNTVDNRVKDNNETEEI